MESTAFLPTLLFTWTVLFSSGMASTFVAPPCDQERFDFNVDNCLSDFNKSMETSGDQEKCPWPDVKRDYYELKMCVDKWTKATWCKKSLADEIFLQVHQIYFSSCGQIQDPPLVTLIMLSAPAIIATLLLPFLCVPLTTRRV